MVILAVDESFLCIILTNFQFINSYKICVMAGVIPIKKAKIYN